MIARLQGTHHGPLLFGRHAPEHVVTLDRVVERLRGQVLGKVARVHEASGRTVGRRQARLGCQRADRRRVVARNDAHVHALRAEVVKSLGRVLAQVLLQRHEGGHRPTRGQLVVDHGLVRTNQRHDAGPLSGNGAHPLQENRVRRHGLVDNELGRTQDPRLASGPPRAPLAGRGEGNGPLDTLDSPGPLGSIQVLPDRLGSGIGTVARGAREGTHHRLRVPRNHVDLAHPDATRRQRARLIQAQAIDAGQHLDGRKLLNEDAPACQRRRSDREIHRREQHQALGDHADDGGDRQDEGLAPIPARAAGDTVLRVKGQRNDREQHDGDDLQHAVDRHLNLGHGTGEGARLLRQALRVHALTDRRRHHAPRAGHDARARKQLIALFLLDGTRFAGEQRLVDLEARGGQDRPVHAHLIAERQLDNVVEHDVASRNDRQGPIAQDTRLRGIHDRQRIQGALCAQLGDDTNHGIDNHHAAEDAIAQVTEQQHDDRRAHDDRVKERQHVLSNDRCHGTRRAVLHAVNRAASDALRDLCRTQAALAEARHVSAHGHPPHPSRYVSTTRQQLPPASRR